MNEKLILTNVYVFPNGMVAVLDQFGKQMPQYQGRKEEVWHLIQRDKTPTTEIIGPLTYKEFK